MFDVNNDGKKDLVIGNFAGILKYYRNAGTVSNPLFVLETDTFGRVLVTNFSTGYSIPRIGYLNGNSLPDLVVGAENGFIYAYPDFSTNLNGTFSLDTNLFRNGMTGLDSRKKIGSYSAPAILNLNGDSLPDLITGFWRAGIQAFINVSNITTSIAPIEQVQWEVFPNPNANNSWQFKGMSGNPYEWITTFIDLAGKQVQPAQSPDANWTIRTSMSPGVYLLQIMHTNGTSKWKKVMVVNP